VRAGIVKEAWDYPWSSAVFHIGKVQEAGIINSYQVAFMSLRGAKRRGNLFY
jgi:hypothetical protein